MATEEKTLDLKKTINLPKTKFAQKANLAQTEAPRLKKWADLNLYGQMPQARKTTRMSGRLCAAISALRKTQRRMCTV